MRPRVIPAEDDRSGRRQLAHPPHASMRPRVIPAEDVPGDAVVGDQVVASMRPRVIPAEDGPPRTRRRGRPWSFNEAAGNPRGRREYRQVSGSGPPGFNEAAGNPRGRRGGAEGETTPPPAASMRPRVIPAEDGGSGFSTAPLYSVLQ